MNDTDLIIDAFIDDEAVDVDALRRALADPAGREYLIEALALRTLMTAEPGGMVDAFQTRRRATGWSARSWAAVAALLTIVASLVGYTAGTRTSDRQVVPEPAASVHAPSPTKVIRLQPGIDWTERVGGN
jgi:hypothetical protein